VYSNLLNNHVYSNLLNNHVYSNLLNNHVYSNLLNNHVYSNLLNNHVYSNLFNNHVYSNLLNNHVHSAMLVTLAVIVGVFYILFRSFGFHAPKYLKIFVFESFYLINLPETRHTHYIIFICSPI
jgi:hypothetical protein